MSGDAPAVTGHYGIGGMRSRIESALERLDGPPTIDQLGGATEFHIGGRPATLDLIDRLGLGVDDRVLDLGSGLGGTARIIAASTGASVHGVDLTPEFVDVAEWLTSLVEVDDVEFSVGSVLDLDGIGTGFTAATMLHVGMNIADKAALCRAVTGALAPRAPFGIYDVMAGPNGGDVTFPVPWASGPDESHVAPIDEYVVALQGAGFAVEVVEDRSEWARAALARLAASSGPPPPLNLGLVMGPTTPTKVANMRAALESGTIAPTVIVARKVSLDT